MCIQVRHAKPLLSNYEVPYFAVFLRLLLLLILCLRSKYCYMCEVSLVVALALLQQCNSTTSHFFGNATMKTRFHATMKTDVSAQQCKRRRYCGNGDVMIGDFS
jgi:hypothetical protein